MKSIRGKMLLWFGVPLFLLLSLLGVVNYIQVRDTVIPLTKELSQEVLVARSAEIGKLLKGYNSDVKTMSRRNLIREGNWDEIKDDLMGRADMINGEYEMLFYVDSEGNFITSTGSEGTSIGRDYFEAIMEGGQDEYISDPIVSRATGEYVFVVACAVINDHGEKIGLIASTVLLKTLSEIAESINIGDKGFGYVVDNSGLLIAHPNDDLRMELNLLESADMGYEGLEEVGKLMVSGESGVFTYKRPDGSNLVTVFNPIPNSPDWALGISLYEEDLMGTANSLMQHIIFLMIGILIIVLMIVTIISGRLASPVLALKDGVETVSSGNLDYTLDINTGDEIENLANAFNKMTGDLKNYIINLQQTTAEKERIEGELQVANKIQASMLPRLFPPYPNVEDLDLYATMEPAREVGGDFYDFFLIDDHRLCFSIGDVSGKGIPAALFMVITRTILKNQALQGNPLPEIFKQTNNMLCSENVENMFVTVFMGILDTKKGEMEYVSAGHNPPLISRNGEDFEYLSVNRSLVLGGIEDYDYHSMKTVVEPEDLIFIYTDGVTEAMNHKGELFTDERMFQAINKLKGKDVKTIISGIRKEVDKFVQDTPASDDVTMLALTLDGRKKD